MLTVGVDGKVIKKFKELASSLFNPGLHDGGTYAGADGPGVAVPSNIVGGLSSRTLRQEIKLTVSRTRYKYFFIAYNQKAAPMANAKLKVCFLDK